MLDKCSQRKERKGFIPADNIYYRRRMEIAQNRLNWYIVRNNNLDLSDYIWCFRQRSDKSPYLTDCKSQ